jgi:flagellar hook-associated protein 2
MGISSLGIGSSILTQDVLDQLRKADESGRINPITLDIANESDKKDALELIDASMTNLIDSINELKSHTLFDERKSEVNGSSVSVSADSNSDVQDFTLEVTTLATKQIEESGAFFPETETIANGSGTLNLNIDGEDFEIDYDDKTTLKDLKKLINDTAGDKIDATIVQINSGEYRLFMSSVDTGSSQNITLSDKSMFSNLKDDRLTDLTVIQSGVDSAFKFNGQDITRSSNKVDDLITGLNITLKEVGTSTISVSQDKEGITDKVDSFVEKYNSAIKQLGEMTKPSVEASQKGIFSGESTIKNMKRALEDMVSSIGGGVATMSDYGFDVSKDGTLSIDHSVFDKKLDDNPKNVEAFFAGGTFTKEESMPSSMDYLFNDNDGTTTELTGAFEKFAAKVEEYTKYNATLDNFKNSLSDRITSLEDRKDSAVKRLDAKYEIMKKQFAAYDSMISKFNSASSMFTQIANAQIAAQKN